MDNRADVIVDALVALALIGLCGVVLVESLSIPHSAFDALGSARVPQVTAGVIAILSAIVLWRSVSRLRVSAKAKAAASVRRRIDAVVVFVLSLGLVLAMQDDVTGFGMLATVYLVLAMGWLERFRLKQMPVIVGLSLIVGFGCAYVFTRIFIVNLPGL